MGWVLLGIGAVLLLAGWSDWKRGRGGKVKQRGCMSLLTGVALFAVGIILLGPREEDAKQSPKTDTDSSAGESAKLPSSDENPADRIEPSLTEQRTWTAKDGRTLQAALLRLDLVEGQYLGLFEKPEGETFEYKIGNLSADDVEFVKGLLKED